ARIFLAGNGGRSAGATFDSEGAGREPYQINFTTHEISRRVPAHAALAWSAFTQRLALLSRKTRRVLVLLDACHSGSAANNEELVRALLTAHAGVLVFAGSRGSEVSLESPEWRHGAFTQAILEALQGQAVSAGEK